MAVHENGLNITAAARQLHTSQPGVSRQLKLLEEEPGEKDSRGQLIDHAQTERTTFVIARDGRIIATLSSADDKIKAAAHAEKSLAIVETLTRR